MTHLALRASRFTNAVALRHGEVSRAMFPHSRVHAITNGVHAGNWASEPFGDLFDRHLPELAARQLAAASSDRHPAAGDRRRARDRQARADRPRRARDGQAAGSQPVHDRARAPRDGLQAQRPHPARYRTAGRDRAQLFGGIQIVFGGKAHPRDWDGKGMIQHIFGASHALAGTVDIVYVEDYDMSWGAALTAGADLWLNTPRPPNEASGTSGMKAAVNGVPSLSVMDGWWVEGALDGVTGWSIDAQTGGDDEAAAAQLYAQLERLVLPAYAGTEGSYPTLMRTTIAVNGSHFNAQRMLAEYTIDAYGTPVEAAADDETRLAG
jgi:starch phosphorylase